MDERSAATPTAIWAEPEVESASGSRSRTVASDLGSRWVSGTALTILGALLVGFVLCVSLVGAVQHARAQSVAYATLRNTLANATTPVAQVDNNGVLNHLGVPVSLLQIPAIHLNEVILEGTTPSVLMNGVGHRRDTVMPGQAGISVIFGRRATFGGPFARIASLKIGTQFSVTTGQGVMNFKVVNVRRAGAKVTLPLPGQSRLVLVTADGPAYLPAGLLYVDADLVGKVAATPAPVFGSNSLPAAEQALGTDSGAWVAIVLWGQLLLAAALAFVWAQRRWGKWQTWIVGVPLLLALSLLLATQAAQLLPNLI